MPRRKKAAPSSPSKPTKHTIEVTLYVANRWINQFMADADLRSEWKWYVSPTTVRITTTTPIDDAYFQSMIEKSKDEKVFWTPAVFYDGVFYIDPSVKELSDGNTGVFITTNEVLHDS